MTQTTNTAQRRSAQGRIDEIVTSQADDDSAWEEPIQVRRSQPTAVSIPTELATRAAFLAQLHREPLENWLTRMIRERIELEEVAFAEAKREMIAHRHVGSPE